MNLVRLESESLFGKSQEIGKRYLLELDVDRLLAPIYEGAGLIPPKPAYGGWEQMEIKGHSVGHYLSAVATMYQATGDLRRRKEWTKLFKRLVSYNEVMVIWVGLTANLLIRHLWENLRWITLV